MISGASAFLISMGCLSVSKLVQFFMTYKEEKEISEDPEEETEISYDFLACGYEPGYGDGQNMFDQVDPYNEGKLGPGMYKTMSMGGHNFVINGQVLYMDGTQIHSTSYPYWAICIEHDKRDSQPYALGFVATGKTAYGASGTAGRFRVNNITEFPCNEITYNIQKAAVNLSEWNSNTAWLESLGDDDYVSLDSDFFEQVEAPEALADTILDAITNNVFEGTLAECPEPVNYATTVKAALDDLDERVAVTTAIDVVDTIPQLESSTGTEGQIAIDSSYIYICIATNTWKRVPIGSW